MEHRRLAAGWLLYCQSCQSIFRTLHALGTRSRPGQRYPHLGMALAPNDACWPAQILTLTFQGKNNAGLIDQSTFPTMPYVCVCVSDLQVTCCLCSNSMVIPKTDVFVFRLTKATQQPVRAW